MELSSQTEAECSELLLTQSLRGAKRRGNPFPFILSSSETQSFYTENGKKRYPFCAGYRFYLCFISKASPPLSLRTSDRCPILRAEPNEVGLRGRRRREGAERRFCDASRKQSGASFLRRRRKRSGSFRRLGGSRTKRASSDAVAIRIPMRKNTDSHGPHAGCSPCRSCRSRAGLSSAQAPDRPASP